MNTRFRTRKTSDWATALAAFLILAVGLETFQSSRQLVADTESSHGDTSAKFKADQECALIDEHFDKLISYFGDCYRSHRAPFNPVYGQLADEHRRTLDHPSQMFVDDLRQLISNSGGTFETHVEG